MLSVEDWAEIRRLHRAEGIPIKVVASALGVLRNTVRAALASAGPPKYVRARGAPSCCSSKQSNSAAANHRHSDPVSRHAHDPRVRPSRAAPDLPFRAFRHSLLAPHTAFAQASGREHQMLPDRHTPSQSGPNERELAWPASLQHRRHPWAPGGPRTVRSRSGPSPTSSAAGDPACAQPAWPGAYTMTARRPPGTGLAHQVGTIPMLKKIFEFLTLKWLWDRR